MGDKYFKSCFYLALLEFFAFINACENSNYKVDFLSPIGAGFIRTPNAFGGGTPLLNQAIVGAGSSFIQVTTSGIEIKTLNGFSTASSINNTTGVAYSNSRFGNNFSSLLINNLMIQPSINKIEKEINK